MRNPGGDGNSKWNDSEPSGCTVRTSGVYHTVFGCDLGSGKPDSLLDFAHQIHEHAKLVRYGLSRFSRPYTMGGASFVLSFSGHP